MNVRRGIFALVIAMSRVGAFADSSVFEWPNDQCRISFSGSTGGIVALGHDDGFSGFVRGDPARALLWRIVFRKPDGTEVTLDNTQVPPPVVSVEKDAVNPLIVWSRVDLPDSPASLHITLTVTANDEGLHLSLECDNTSPVYGAWTVDFPVVARFSQKGKPDVAIGRGSWGRQYRQAADKISGEYPSHSMPMQMMLVHEGDRGLYLATDDPGARYKTFDLDPGGEFHVRHRAEGMGVPGNDWAGRFTVSAYRGNWMVGAKKCRAWATSHAPWAKKGLLSQRKDVPESMKNVCAWFLGGGTVEEGVPPVKKFAEAIGAPVGVHWYNWHEIPFDVQYPNYFPTKPGFAEGVKELTDAGIVVMPYINARLWDSGNENFAEARPFAAKDEKGEPIIETYGSGAKLAVMCPTQKYWQDKVGEIIRRLGEEFGVNAVYLDQIASAPARVCFDKSHGHPVGSGDWWADGYRDMLTPIKEWCTTGGRQIGLTTENDAEPYMDNLDGHLIWTPRSDDEIPLNTAVYSGYTLYFASNRAFFDDASYCLCQARDFTWGAQLGWDGAGILEPEHKAKLEFLSRLARMRERAKDYLVYGELLEVLEPTNDVPYLHGKWNTPEGDGPVRLRAVHATLWRSPNRLAAVLLANADTEPNEFAFWIDADRYDFAGSTKWSPEVSTPDSGESGTSYGVVEGRQFELKVVVGARDAMMVVLTSANAVAIE